VVSSGCLIAEDVNTESKSRHATNDIKGQIKEHVFGKSVRRPHQTDPGYKWSAPLVVGQSFTVQQVALLRVDSGEGLPKMQMPVPEIDYHQGLQEITQKGQTPLCLS